VLLVIKSSEIRPVYHQAKSYTNLSPRGVDNSDLTSRAHDAAELNIGLLGL
jgi:hypothetical protein